jgi:glutamine synthetase
MGMAWGRGAPEPLGRVPWGKLAQKLHGQCVHFPTFYTQENLMAKTVADVMKMVKENEVKFIDFRFTDTRGKWQHITVPVSQFDENKFEDGQAFDGSSIAGWKGIEASDMLLIPDAASAIIDPFFEEVTLVMICDVIEPTDGKAYERDPRSIAKRAETYLKQSGLGDTAYFGPEPEFFLFDEVRWSTEPNNTFYANPWASRSKCTTTKWRERASAKSAPSSPHWWSAPTGHCCKST